MRIETLKSLIGAQLLNAPSISGVNGIVFEAKKIKRGDLFVAYDTSQIPLALQNGAYGVLTDTVTQVLDPEIAWLKTPDLGEALIKLARYTIDKENITTVLLAPEVFEILSQTTSDSGVGFLSTQNNSLWQVFKPARVFFAHERSFLGKLTQNYHDNTAVTQKEYKLLKASLFETTFIYRGAFFQHIKVPPFFISHFITAENIAKEYGIDTKPGRFEYGEFFYPQFCSKNFQPTEFGKGAKVLLFCSDFAPLRHYLRTEYAHLKVIFLSASDPEKLYGQLKKYRFDIAVLSGVKRGILDLPPFARTQSAPSLF